MVGRRSLVGCRQALGLEKIFLRRRHAYLLARAWTDAEIGIGASDLELFQEKCEAVFHQEMRKQ
ncbi:hypothetical protein D3C87_2204960 [compost metagenome]